MHKSKADAAQRQICVVRSLQSQLQSNREQISLLELELAASVAVSQSVRYSSCMQHQLSSAQHSMQEQSMRKQTCGTS